MPLDLRSIENEDQARNWILSLIQEVKERRIACDIYIPDGLDSPAEVQRKNYVKFMLAHGQALGALLTLFKCNMISTVMYNELRQQVLATYVPTVIGSMRG